MHLLNPSAPQPHTHATKIKMQLFIPVLPPPPPPHRKKEIIKEPKRELKRKLTAHSSDSQPRISWFLTTPPPLPPPPPPLHPISNKHTLTLVGRRANIKNKQTENWLAEKNYTGADYIWPLTPAVRQRRSPFVYQPPRLRYFLILWAPVWYLLLFLTYDGRNFPNLLPGPDCAGGI